MVGEEFFIEKTPAVLYKKRAIKNAEKSGKNQNLKKGGKVFLVVHGQGGNKEEAADFAPVALKRGYDVLAIDLPAHGGRTDGAEFLPWVVIPELKAAFKFAKSRYKSVSVRATSIGAWLSLLAFKGEKIAECLLVSPLFDMEDMIFGMMKAAGVTEEKLKAEKVINADLGGGNFAVLSWEYLQFARNNEPQPLCEKTFVLRADNDETISAKTVEDFCEKFGCELTVLRGGEHWLHTESDKLRVKNWENRCLKNRSRFSVARNFLLFWTLFIGIGALCGGVGMLVDPSGKAMGMDAMLPYFQKLPFADIFFNDLLFSGVALIIVNGITNMISAVLLLKNKKSGAVTGGIFGVTLMLWICIQFYMFPLNFTSTIYFIFGLLQAITGYCAAVFYTQEHFSFNLSDYKNIGKNDKVLVVYFSRLNYVKKVAYQKANELGARVYSVKPTELTQGTLGFWWCGRFGMHKWGMPIAKIAENLSSYEKVIICTPVWVFSLCSPMREFCKKASGKIKRADYVIVHHTAGKYQNVADEMNDLLGIKAEKVESCSCKVGRYKKR